MATCNNHIAGNAPILLELVVRSVRRVASKLDGLSRDVHFISGLRTPNWRSDLRRCGVLVLGSTSDQLSPKLRQIEEVRDFFRSRGSSRLVEGRHRRILIHLPIVHCALHLATAAKRKARAAVGQGLPEGAATATFGLFAIPPDALLSVAAWLLVAVAAAMLVTAGGTWRW
jgi:hypothetical protein